MTSDNSEVVVDTNVPVVSNGNHDRAGIRCIRSCIARLAGLRDTGTLLLDDKNLIIQEYKNSLNFSGEPGPGDAFFKWLHENQANPESCRKVEVTIDTDREFGEFPDDPHLSAFDRSDRKFVAVALASGTSPEILNASDTDWWHHGQALQAHGVNVVFLCPELMTPDT